jgi:hypothetical protein
MTCASIRPLLITITCRIRHLVRPWVIPPVLFALGLSNLAETAGIYKDRHIKRPAAIPLSSPFCGKSYRSLIVYGFVEDTLICMVSV